MNEDFYFFHVHYQDRQKPLDISAKKITQYSGKAGGLSPTLRRRRDSAEQLDLVDAPPSS